MSEEEINVGTETQKIAMSRKIYNEVLGVVEEFAIEVNGYNLNSCRKHFDELAKEHDKFNEDAVKKKMTSHEQRF